MAEDPNARQRPVFFVDYQASEPALGFLQADLDLDIRIDAQAQVLSVPSPIRMLRPKCDPTAGRNFRRGNLDFPPTVRRALRLVASRDANRGPGNRQALRVEDLDANSVDRRSRRLRRRPGGAWPEPSGERQNHAQEREGDTPAPPGSLGFRKAEKNPVPIGLMGSLRAGD